MLKSIDVLNTSDSADLKSGSNLRGQSSLRAAQDDVKKLLRSRHWLNIFPCSLHGELQIGGFHHDERQVMLFLHRINYVEFVFCENLGEILGYQRRSGRTLG